MVSTEVKVISPLPFRRETADNGPEKLSYTTEFQVCHSRCDDRILCRPMFALRRIPVERFRRGRFATSNGVSPPRRLTISWRKDFARSASPLTRRTPTHLPSGNILRDT